MRKKLFLVFMLVSAIVVVLLGAGYALLGPQLCRREWLSLCRKELNVLCYRLSGSQTKFGQHLYARYVMTLHYVNGAPDLDIPHAMWSAVGVVSQPEGRGDHLAWHVEWLEFGFRSCGVKIYYTADGEARCAKVPFNEAYFTDENRRFVTKSTLRNLHIPSGQHAVDIVTKIPISAVSEPMFVSIYDNADTDSNRVRCFVGKSLLELGNETEGETEAPEAASDGTLRLEQP